MNLMLRLHTNKPPIRFYLYVYSFNGLSEYNHDIFSAIFLNALFLFCNFGLKKIINFFNAIFLFNIHSAIFVCRISVWHSLYAGFLFDNPCMRDFCLTIFVCGISVW